MAHFAQLNENNIVTQVIVVHDNDCLDENGNELESVGINFCTNLLGGVWKQTSYNGKMRKNYAGIGFTYHADIDAFVPPQPYPSWTLNADASWQPPVAMPTDNQMYSWNELAQAWEVQNGN